MRTCQPTRGKPWLLGVCIVLGLALAGCTGEQPQAGVDATAPPVATETSAAPTASTTSEPEPTLGGDGTEGATQGDDGPSSGAVPSVDPRDWQRVTAAAEGQTVRWWVPRGNEAVNDFIDQQVIPAARQRGVTLARVPVGDPTATVEQIIEEARQDGGAAAGGIDLAVVTPQAFTEGSEAGIWLRGWAGEVPNASSTAPEASRASGGAMLTPESGELAELGVVAIPSNAASQAGALMVANLLLNLRPQGE
jgi:ABC-type uncharacterized transport system YnjBCD substrate-binding protein